MVVPIRLAKRTWRGLLTGTRANLTSPPPLRARCGRAPQPERGHLLAVADEEHVAHDHRVVPGLAVDGFESRNLGELVGRGVDQRDLSLFGEHQQQVLVGEQDELAVTVASALPRARAVLEPD